MRKLLLTAGAVLAIAAASQASLVLTTPEITVPEGTPTVTFNITVASDPAVNVGGLNFLFQVGDMSGGPIISSVTIIDPANMFTASNLNPLGGVTSGDQYYYATAATQATAGDVAANGILATIVLNTAGLTPGSWALNPFIDNEGEVTWIDFAGVAVDTFNVGSLTITPVPEPAALALLGLGGLFIRRRRA